MYIAISQVGGFRVMCEKPVGERKSKIMEIRIEKTACPKERPGQDNPLVFGTIFTDHMFEMDYEEGKGWYDPRVVPYHKLELEPSAMVFHYGQ